LVPLLSIDGCAKSFESNVKIRMKREAVQYFSSDYSEARERFLEAAHAAGAAIESFENPDRCSEGEQLFTDVALIGQTDARNILVLGSGTHGVEGFTGSALQTGLLREGVVSNLDEDLSVVMIHAINPYGFACLRRYNEDNVDLNRNFVDHTNPYPENPEYEKLSKAISPKSLCLWSGLGFWSRIGWHLLANGRAYLTKAIGSGQYSRPEGLSYGGNTETWSNQTIQLIAERFLSKAERVVIIDFHTGLGEYGDSEIILCVPTDSPTYKRAMDIWGADKIKSTVAGESVSVHIRGPLKAAFPELLPNSQVTATSLEFGTVPLLRVLSALWADNWLHHHGGMDHPKAKSIKSKLLRAFYPDEDEWNVTVWEKGREAAKKALSYLRSSH